MSTQIQSQHEDALVDFHYFVRWSEYGYKLFV